MTVRAEVYEGLAPQWSALAAGGPLLASPAWLRAMAGRLGERVVTLVAYGDGQPRVAALASVQPAPRPTEFFDLHHLLVGEAPALPLTDAARRARARLAGTAPAPARWTPSLVVMLPGYECVPVGPGADDPRLLCALVDRAWDWAAAAGIRAVAFLYTRPEATALAAVLAGRGFLAVPLSISWDLPVPPDGLPGYLAALPRKRRQEARRELRRLAAEGVELRALPAGDAAGEAALHAMAGLRCQLVRKYRGGVDEAAERARLVDLAHGVAGGRPHVLVAEVDGRVVGYALFAEHGGDWHCLSVGYDYTDERSRLAYFGTAYYLAVSLAAAAGARRLGYGQGAAPAKRARGCVGTPLTGWVRSADPQLAAAARASAGVTALLPPG
jgi:GNAT acetyltransferase-like protein